MQIVTEIGRDWTALSRTSCLVDSTRLYNVLPVALAQDLGIEVALRVGGFDHGLACFRLEDREAVLMVTIADVPQPILGRTFFDGLGLRMKPDGMLEYDRPYGPALMGVSHA